MALQDVQNILAGLVQGQQLRQGQISQQLQAQQLQQQAAQNLAELKLRQQQQDLDTQRVQNENQARIAESRRQALATQAQILQHPETARSMGSPIGVPDASGNQQYALPITTGEMEGSQDQTPVTAMVPTREQELINLGNQSKASESGATSLEDTRYAHEQDLAESNRTFTEEQNRLNREAEAARQAKQLSTQMQIAKMGHGLYDPDGTGNGTNFDPTVQALESGKLSVEGLIKQVPDPGARMFITQKVKSDGFTPLTEQQVNYLKQYQDITSVLPTVRDTIEKADGAGPLVNYRQIDANKQKIGATVQSLRGQMGDNSLRSQKMLEMIGGALVPNTNPIQSSEQTRRGNYNFTVDQLNKRLDDDLSNIPEGQRAIIKQELGITALPTYSSAQDKTTLPRPPKVGTPMNAQIGSQYLNAYNGDLVKAKAAAIKDGWTIPQMPTAQGVQ